MTLWPFRRRTTPSDAARTLSALSAQERSRIAMTERQAVLAKAKLIAGGIDDEATRNRLLARF
jgi:hypothetical protein